MVVFRKPKAAAKSQQQAANTTESSPGDQPLPKPMLWSDVLAKRKSTYPGVAPGPPIQKLFEIFELCEGVLEHLSMADILRAGQVCRKQQTIIQNSSLLQAKLFLAPALKTKTIAISPRRTLLAGSKAEHHIAAIKAKKDGQDTGEIKLFNLHPALARSRRSIKVEDGVVRNALSFGNRQIDDEDGDVSLKKLRLDLNQVPAHCSLRKMYITQPPVKEVEVNIRGRGDYPGCYWHQAASWVTTSDANGVTFGQFIATAEEMMKEAYARGYCACRFNCLVLVGGIVISEQTRLAVEAAGELSEEEDPTKWVLKEGILGIKEGGFEM